MAHPFQKYRDSERARAKQYRQEGGGVGGFVQGAKSWLFPRKEDVGHPPVREAPRVFTGGAKDDLAERAITERMRSDEAERAAREQAMPIARPGVPRKHGGKA